MNNNKNKYKRNKYNRYEKLRYYLLKKQCYDKSRVKPLSNKEEARILIVDALIYLLKFDKTFQFPYRFGGDINIWLNKPTFLALYTNQTDKNNKRNYHHCTLFNLTGNKNEFYKNKDYPYILAFCWLTYYKVLINLPKQFDFIPICRLPRWIDDQNQYSISQCGKSVKLKLPEELIECYNYLFIHEYSEKNIKNCKMKNNFRKLLRNNNLSYTLQPNQGCLHMRIRDNNFPHVLEYANNNFNINNNKYGENLGDNFSINSKIINKYHKNYK